MVVDALLVYSSDFKPGDAFVLLEETSCVADDVFDEDGVIKRLHRNMAFVRAFEEGVNRGGG